MGQISETDKYLSNQLEDKEKNNKMRTFSTDNLLPSLPLPNLDDTLRVYLESVKPFLTKIELLRTEKCVESFKNGVGEKLHFFLIEKAKNERNWVNFTDYWLFSQRDDCLKAEKLIIFLELYRKRKLSSVYKMN